MSTFLANLLSKETSGFKKFIEDMEFVSGHKSNDLKLLSDIKIATNHKIKSLGLNPSDTTAPELYHALNNLFILHDNFIVKKNNLKYESPLSDTLDKIVATFNQPVNAQSVFSLKPSVIRKILAKNQPLKTSVLLGHRSLSSMLKNENPRIVLSVAYYIESEEWKRSYLDLLKELSISDFEYKKIELIVLNNPKFQKISKAILKLNKHSVISLENIGQILIIPLNSRLTIGFSILTYAYIIHQLKLMVRFSKFIQNQQFNSHLGATISTLFKNTELIDFYVSKYGFSWDSIADFTKQLSTLSEDEREDIILQQSPSNDNQLNKILMNIEPALHFWFDTDKLGYIDNDETVSFNLLDVCYNGYNRLSLKDSSNLFMQEAVSSALIAKYFESGECSNQLSKQISGKLEGNESLQIFKNRVVYS